MFQGTLLMLTPVSSEHWMDAQLWPCLHFIVWVMGRTYSLVQESDTETRVAWVARWLSW